MRRTISNPFLFLQVAVGLYIVFNTVVYLEYVVTSSSSSPEPLHNHPHHSETTTSAAADVSSSHSLKKERKKKRTTQYQQPSKKKKKYNFTAGICVVVKDAEAYFEEWIDYHIGALKFDSVVMYDHSTAYELQRWYNNTRNHPIYSHVDIIHWKDTGAEGYYDEQEEDWVQNLVYKDCITNFGLNGPRIDYIALIDIDEFIVLQSSQYSDIHGMLQEYLVPFGGSLTMNWMLVGTSNKTVYSPIPVLKRFQYRENTPHNVIKTIVKSTDYEYSLNPHGAKLLDGKHIHNTLFPGSLFKESSEAFASDHTYPSDVVLLYHYRYNSLKEYMMKRCWKGAIDLKEWCGDDGRLRDDIPDHGRLRPGTVFDDKTWRFLTANVPKYKIFDEMWEDFS